MSTLDLSKPHRPIHAGVILMGGFVFHLSLSLSLTFLFDSVRPVQVLTNIDSGTRRETEILDVAPIELIHSISKYFVQQIPDALVTPEIKPLTAQAVEFVFHWVSEAGPSKPSRLTSGIQLLPTDSFETCPPLDIVLIGAHDFKYTPNAVELAYVRKAYEESTAFLSICGGIQVPLMAGLLEGKKATGPRMMLDVLRQQAPNTEWLEKRWVQDGKLWTSGAMLNGQDMMYAFTNRYWGGDGEDETLLGFTTKGTAWPNRDVDYKDVPWKI